MEKETLQEVMRNHNISSNEEAQEAVRFVVNLLEAKIDYTEEKEPYATNTIDEMIKASRGVNDLIDDL